MKENNVIAALDVATTSQENTNKMANFNVNQLIAELSQNSRASQGEIEIIQRRLIQQANEILKVNAFVNSQTVQEPRIIDCTQKYTNSPVYGRPAVIPRSNVQTSNQADKNMLEVSRQNPTNPNMAAPPKAGGQPGNQLDTQLVPERLQEKPFQDNGAMINSAQGNMQRVAATVDAGRSAFFYETGSMSGGRSPASAHAATTRGECLSVFKFCILLLNETN